MQNSIHTQKAFLDKPYNSNISSIQKIGQYMDDLMIKALMNLINLTQAVIRLKPFRQQDENYLENLKTGLKQIVKGEEIQIQLNFGSLEEIENSLYNRQRLIPLSQSEIITSRQDNLQQHNWIYDIQDQIDFTSNNQLQNHYIEIWRMIKTNQQSFKNIYLEFIRLLTDDNQSVDKNKQQNEVQNQTSNIVIDKPEDNMLKLENQIDNDNSKFPFCFHSIQQFFSIFCKNATYDFIFNQDFLKEAEDNYIILFEQLRNIIVENQNIHLSKLLLVMQSCSGLVSSVDPKGIKRILAFINGYYIIQNYNKISNSDLSFQNQQIQKLTKIETIYGQTQENKYLTKVALSNLGQYTKLLVLYNQAQIKQARKADQTSDGLRQLNDLVPDIDSLNLKQLLINQSISIDKSQIFGVDKLQQLIDYVLNDNWIKINSELKNILNQIQSSKLFRVAIMHLRHILKIHQAINIELDKINIEYFYINDSGMNACTLCDATIIINLYCFNVWMSNHQKELDFDIIKGFIAFVVLMILHEQSHILNRLGHQKWEFNTILMKKQIQSYCIAISKQSFL